MTAGATTEEVAAGIAPDLEPMTREQQVEYDKTVRVAALGVVSELFEDRADMTLDIDEGRVVSALDAINAEAKRQGMTDLQRDAYAMDVVTAAAANNNTTYEAMASQLDKLPVRGSATVEFVQDVANYRLKLNQGADVDTLYEEATHIEFKRFRAADPQAMEKARSWKQMVEQETGKVTHGDTDTDVDEWVARKGVIGQSRTTRTKSRWESWTSPSAHGSNASLRNLKPYLRTVSCSASWTRKVSWTQSLRHF